MSSGLKRRIVVDPKIMVGKPIIKGTRIPVDAIIHRLAQGASVEEIIQDYPAITKQDVKAALEYAEDLVRGEDILMRLAPARVSRPRSNWIWK